LVTLNLFVEWLVNSLIIYPYMLFISDFVPYIFRVWEIRGHGPSGRRTLWLYTWPKWLSTD